MNALLVKRGVLLFPVHLRVLGVKLENMHLKAYIVQNVRKELILLKVIRIALHALQEVPAPLLMVKVVSWFLKGVIHFLAYSGTPALLGLTRKS